MAGSTGPFGRQECARARVILTGAAIAVATLLVPRAAHAGDEQELESARLRLEGGQPSDAATRLARMLDAGAPPCKTGPDVSAQGCRVTDIDVIQRARGYYAIALVALDRVPEANVQIDAMLERDPTFRPNPAAFPTKVMDLIIGEQARLADRLSKTTGFASPSALDTSRRTTGSALSLSSPLSGGGGPAFSVGDAGGQGSSMSSWRGLGRKRGTVISTLAPGVSSRGTLSTRVSTSAPNA